MTSRKGGLLRLSNQEDNLGFVNTGNISILDRGYLISPDKRKIIKESLRQKAGMEAIWAKTNHAVHLVADMDEYALIQFIDTAAFISKTRKQAEGTDYEGYIDQYSHHLTQVAAEHMNVIVRTGATVILQEVARSPYPPEEEPRGILQRILGG